MDITGRAGLFLEGKVSPELQGVEISITERGAATPLITVATNEMGAYRYENTKNRVCENEREDIQEFFIRVMLPSGSAINVIALASHYTNRVVHKCIFFFLKE